MTDRIAQKVMNYVLFSSMAITRRVIYCRMLKTRVIVIFKTLSLSLSLSLSIYIYIYIYIPNGILGIVNKYCSSVVAA